MGKNALQNYLNAHFALQPKRLATPVLDGTYRPYPLRFHVEKAGADAKLMQYGSLGVAYHHRHPISTIPVARITAHATVPGLYYKSYVIKGIL